MDNDTSAFNTDRFLEQQDQMLENNIKRYVEFQTKQPSNITGLCCDCDEKIGEGRRKAVPNALRCISCATAFENKKNFKKGLDSKRSIIENTNP